MHRFALALPLTLALVTGCDAGKVSSPPNGASGGAPSGGAPPVVPHDGAPPSNTPSPTAPGGYYTSGNSIFNEAGVRHLFHGLDRPSLEWNSTGENLSQADYQTMATWGANVVRIALNQSFWLEGPGYPATIDQQIQWIEAAGMDVILDLHWSDRGEGGQAAQQRMADQNSKAFWTQVADKYKTDGRVQFELYNEPHNITWDVWLSGGPSGDGFTVVGMQELYDAVRATGANNLVIAGGVDWAYDLTGVPSHRLKGYNVAYATHPYDETGKQPANWRVDWGFLAATDPVLITEFGVHNGDCGTGYYSSVIQYADSVGASWTGWAWYVGGCGFPSLIADWSGTPTAAGGVVKAALQAY
jgi:hypothetical protein